MLQPVEDRYPRSGETKVNTKRSQRILRRPESDFPASSTPPDNDGKREHEKVYNNGDNCKYDYNFHSPSTTRAVQMRVSQDERSDDGDRGLQEQFPSTEPDTDPSPNGDRENGLTDEHKEVAKETIVETVETVVELENQEENMCELC